MKTKRTKDRIINITDPKDPRRYSGNHIHVNGRCLKNRRGPVCAEPVRVRKTAYATKRMNGANILPHGVHVTMITLRDGRARWTYTETFRAAQFPSLKAARKAIADSAEVFGAMFSGLGMTTCIRGLRITLSGTSSREDFSDSMVGEFLVWGGKLGDMTIRKFLTTAMRFVAAGWRP